MATKRYILYCDESAKKGQFFSNFYGGALVNASDREAIERLLSEKKESLNISGEMKWTKITRNYQDKYIDFIRYFFEFVESGRIKIRIMFTHNYRRPRELTKEQRENQYFLLYYQMVKHAFGFVHSNPHNIDRIFVALHFDEIPHSKEKLDRFRRYITNIQNTFPYTNSDIYFPEHDFAHVDSKLHCILQGLDIILGSMFFRLNDLHKEKPEGARMRAKRTIAKENVYKEINRNIRNIYPYFNIGTTTGTQNGEIDRWLHRYRHWCFVPYSHEIDENAVKPR